MTSNPTSSNPLRSRRTSQPDRRRCVRAFTLAELVIALAIFALAATVLSQSVLNALTALNNVQYGESSLRDFIYARQKILAIDDRDVLTDGGEFVAPSGNKLDWKVEISATDVLDLHQIDLTIERRAESGPEPPFIGRYYVLRPKWSDSETRTALLTAKREEYERRLALSGLDGDGDDD